MNTPASQAPPPRIGRYEVQRELGRGAMGVVYEASDPLLGRRVALKTIRLGFTVTPDERAQFEQRFFSEARAVAKLQHPSIVVVHDVGQDPETSDLFIALEYLKGRTLTDVVRDGGLMPWREGLRIVQRLASALHHAHENGIVHRDVKPDNVMLLDSGEPKLMDFGIAKVETVQLTVAGQIFGTPRYMSPEQALGTPADARSDIFALGSVAYFLLTGHHAFGAPTIPLIITQVVQEDPAAPSILAGDLPEGVDRILWRMLAKKAADRYADGRSVVEDLEDVLADRPPRHAGNVPPQWKHPDAGDELLGELLLEAEPARPGGTEADITGVALPGARRAAPPPATPTTPPAGRRWLPLAAGLVGLLLIAVVAAALWPRGVDEPGARRTDPTTAGPSAAAPRKHSEAGKTEEPGQASASEEAASEAPIPDGSARVVFQLTHSLRRGRIEISVDGKVVFEDDLEGRTTSRLKFIKTSKGRLETSVDVPAGEHTIRVEVRWDDDAKARSVRGTFDAGQTRHLDAELGGMLRKNLSLDLN